jgi:hypothetical protein
MADVTMPDKLLVTNSPMLSAPGRQNGYSDDRGRNQKLLYHADASVHVAAIPMANHGIRENPYPGNREKVFLAFAGAGTMCERARR